MVERVLDFQLVKNILDLHNVKYGVTNTKDGVLFYFHLEKWDTK